MKTGKVFRIAGPVAIAELHARMFDIVLVGEEKLLGEVIQINGDKCTIQVYEDTTGLKPGAPVVNTNEPLSIELGPGLLSSIYDGIQRPLPALQAQMGDFITRGATAPGLSRDKKWTFKATAKKGDTVSAGSIIGAVMENQILHKIMIPPGQEGKIASLDSGSFKVDEVIGKLDSGYEIKLMQKWSVRKPRPTTKKLPPIIPLITGQRILDALFPIAKGGVAAIPGPFGSGKCITAETPILVNQELTSIKDIFEQNKETNATEIEQHKYETIVKLKKPLKVQTFDGKTLKDGFATHVYKGKTSQLIEVKTRSGRKVKITPVHKLFKLSKNLEVVETPAGKLREGDFILSPRLTKMQSQYQKLIPSSSWRVADSDIFPKVKKVIESYSATSGLTKKEISKKLKIKYATINAFSSVNKPTVSFIRKLNTLCKANIKLQTYKTERQSLPITLPTFLDEDFAEFLGCMMADGMIKGNKSVHFFNADKYVRGRFSQLVKTLFGLPSKEYYARTVWAISVNSQALVQVLTNLGYPLVKKSRNLKLPKQLLSSPASVIKSFLKAYIICDGHVSKTDIEIVTASKDMQSGLCYLLTQLGVLYTASQKVTNGRTYYRVFISPREAIKIDEYYSKKYYFNSTDIVPMTSSLLKEILGDVKPHSLNREGISMTSYYKEVNQTTKTFQQVIQKTATNQSLQALASSLDYVFCDEIKEIKFINETVDVYDLTVANTHNFVGGDIPMILHNTVTQQALAKWCDADIIVYVGCGERGNEMTEVLTEFPELIDPRSGKPLLNRTILIANTSNMPVAAREASIYCGITMGEYYRDMGYNVAVMADSTSRWAEAMREISSRLEELPGEEGYPAYLSTRLADFYERAGRYTNLNNTTGSISVIGAVSPAGGDFSEPVTQGTLRVVKCFWALDAKLAQRRHFPAINWLTSYSLYLDSLESWFTENVADDWRANVDRIMAILQEEDKLLEIVQLVGSDALPEKEQVTLEIAKLAREVLLQQNAFHDIDTYSEPKKTYLFMKTILKFGDLAYAALSAGTKVSDIVSIKSFNCWVAC